MRNKQGGRERWKMRNNSKGIWWLSTHWKNQLWLANILWLEKKRITTVLGFPSNPPFPPHHHPLRHCITRNGTTRRHRLQADSLNLSLKLWLLSRVSLLIYPLWWEESYDRLRERKERTRCRQYYIQQNPHRHHYHYHPTSLHPYTPAVEFLFTLSLLSSFFYLDYD